MRHGTTVRSNRKRTKVERDAAGERGRERKWERLRTSKTCHNAISPPSLERKIKFLPLKFTSTEEAMMDG